MSHILKLQDFHYYYGNIHAIKGISLNVEEGEIVTLIGANGAGKSTTLKSISGLTSARGVKGTISFGGREIQGMPPSSIAKLGLCQVLEGRHIFSQLTVVENLEMGAYFRKDKKGVKRDMDYIYNLFPRLDERKKQRGGTLSGGEQQMLAIGRALLSNPKLLLLDEPSLGLAPIIVSEIFAAIDKIHKEGTTILLVEQNSKLALKFSDRAYVLQTGEIIMQGKSAELAMNEDVKKAYLGNS